MIINPLIPNVPLSFMYAIISINNQVIIIHLLIIIIYIICIAKHSNCTFLHDFIKQSSTKFTDYF